MDLGHIESILSSDIMPELNSTNYKLASVLIVIYGKKPTVLMTKKPQDMKFHAGEISFPGGKPEQNDNDLLETALRETCEEIGLTIQRNQVIGQLEPVKTLNSGFLILPFVAIINQIPTLSANAEVETIFHMPLEELLKTMAQDPEPSHNIIQEMYVFEFEGKIVWGASARMLKQIAERLQI